MPGVSGQVQPHSLLGITTMPPRLLLFFIRAGLAVTSKRLMKLASVESQSLRHNFIGTEHAMLALARLPDSRLNECFKQGGVGVDDLRRGVIEVTGLGPVGPSPVPSILTPRLKKVIAIAKEQAPQAKHLTVPQSLFVGIITEGQGTAMRVLKSLGFAPEQLLRMWPEAAIPHHVPIQRYKPRELLWFVHRAEGGKRPLAFVIDNKAGVYIFEGGNGIHYTGPGHTWVDKLMEITNNGYVWLADARAERIVPDDWEPPEQDARRDGILARIQNGEL